jgi:hypothetical protein
MAPGTRCQDKVRIRQSVAMTFFAAWTPSSISKTFVRRSSLPSQSGSELSFHFPISSERFFAVASSCSG